jgi:hypothetical protein
VARLVKLACAGTQLPSDLRQAGCSSSSRFKSGGGSGSGSSSSRSCQGWQGS